MTSFISIFSSVVNVYQCFLERTGVRDNYFKLSTLFLKCSGMLTFALHHMTFNIPFTYTNSTQFNLPEISSIQKSDYAARFLSLTFQCAVTLSPDISPCAMKVT